MKFKCANIAILIVIIVFFSAGCGSSGGGDSTTTAADTENDSGVSTTETSGPLSVSGSGADTTSTFHNNGGITTFTLNHDGTSNFIVRLWNRDSGDYYLIENEIGKVENSKKVKMLDAGDYFFAVEADGEWSIEADGEWFEVEGSDNNVDILSNLNGNVYDSLGNPISGAVVSVFSDIYKTTTEADGYYSFNVSEGKHTILVSRPGYIDTYQQVNISDDDSQEKHFLMGSSRIPTKEVLFDSGDTLSSNDINGNKASLYIPLQSSNFTIGSEGGLNSLDISLEYLDVNNPLPVPLPNYPETLEPSPKIGGKQAPSVLAAIKPALLEMSTEATLTLPNPDSLPVGTKILRFDPVKHLWVDAGTAVNNIPENSTTLSITKGGIYGIFYEEPKIAAVKGTAKPGSIVFISDEVYEVGAGGQIYINDVHVPSSGSLSVSVLDPDTGAITKSSVTPVAGEIKDIEDIQGAVASVTLLAGSSELAADGESYTAIKATVLDSNGNPVVDGTRVNFHTTEGTLLDTTALTTSGEAVVILTSSIISGPAIITANSGGVSGNATVNFKPVSNILSLSLSQISVKSDNSDSCTITASVLDIKKVPVEGVRVIFSATGGQISASSVFTDANGEAKIIFKSGTVEKKNQTVNITASVAELDPKIIPVQITGTTVILFTENTNLEIDPQNPDKAKTSLTITVKDAGTLPIFDAPVTISVDDPTLAALALSNGDTDVNGILTGNTDVDGTLRVEVTGAGVGNVTVTTEALGDTATQTYSVGAVGEIFSIVDPLEDIVRLSTGTPLKITVKAPDSGSDYDKVTFATTFGAWDGGTGTVVSKSRNVENKASAELSSDKSGFATVQVYYTDEDGHSTKDSLTVAISAPSSEAAQIALQASSTVVAPRTGDTSNTVTLWAKVRNANDQVVGGAPVAFLIENPTGGGETISPAVVFTNDYGIAETTFTSGSLSSDAQGVTLKASVVGMPAIKSASISIIIGGTASSVVIGQSSEIKSVNEDTAYQLPMSVLVVDSNGNPMAGSQVTLGAWPKRYATGYWIEIDNDVCIPAGSRAEILNEDTNRNSIKDPGEDLNEDGGLTPSHSAAGSVPGIVITDDNGVAQFDLIYLKSSAGWIEDSITASAVVYGTETQSTYTFWLPWAEPESCNLSDSPYSTISEIDSVNIQTVNSSIVADGTASTKITATVKNVNGYNVADETPVTFTTTAGTLSDGGNAKTVNGIAKVTLTSSNNLGTATITATAGGLSDTTTVSFVPGAVNKIVLTANPNNLTGDGISTSTIRAVVTDVNNNLIVGEAISFTVTGNCGGTISSATAITNSGGVATIVYTSSGTVGTDTITGTSVNGTTDNVEIELITASVSSVSVNAGSASIVADGSTTLIRAAVKDINGDNVADETPVTFTTTAGALDADATPTIFTTTTTNGVATATLTSSDNLGTATITATAGGVSDTTGVSFIPGAVNSILLTATPNNLTADSSSSSTIRAFVTDVNGNAVANGEIISFSVTSGTGVLSAPTAATTGGTATVTYTASGTAGTETITAEATNATTKTVDITLITEQIGGIALSLGTASLVADGQNSTLVSATITNIQGNNVLDGTSVTFTTTDGDIDINTTNNQLSVTTSTSNGVASTILQSSTTAGQYVVTAIAGGISQFASVEFVPGPAADVAGTILSANPTVIDADGVSTSLITASVVDENDNPVADGATVNFYTTAGGLSPASSATANGIATAVLTSSTTNETATVTAIVDSVSKTVDVTFGAGPGTGEPVYIIITVDSENIRVKGTGGIESAVVTASVKDENGQPYNDSAGNIKFEILTGPSGGEILDSGDGSPSASELTTTVGGIATVSLNSGSISGTVRVKVTVLKDGGGAVLAPANQIIAVSTQIGIEAGDPFNITLYKAPDVEDNGDGSISWIISAMVQDQYGNPVADNTGVYFGLVDNEPYGYKSSATNGATDGTNTFSSAGTNFLGDGVVQFDTLIILEGQDEGGHTIDTPANESVTLFYTLNGSETGLDFVAGNAELGTICGVVPTGNLEPDTTCTPSGGIAIKGVAHTRLTWAEPAIFKPFYVYAETEGRNLGKTFGKPYSYPGIEPIAIDVTLDPASLFAGEKSITVNAHFHDGADPFHNIREEELIFTTDNTIISGFGTVGTALTTVSTDDKGFATANLVTKTDNCIDSNKQVTISVAHGQYTGTATLTIKATAPTAGFTSTDGGNNDTVFFVDSSTTVAGTSITDWDWDFDGNSNTIESTVRSPTYNFGGAGDYTVTLTVTNDFGCTDSLTKIVTVP